MTIITTSTSDSAGSFTLDGVDYPKGVYKVRTLPVEDFYNGAVRVRTFYGIEGINNDTSSLVYPQDAENFTVNGVVGIDGLAQLLASSSSSGSATTNAADLTSGVLADERVQESNVTQHEDALSITTSQLLGTLINSESDNFAFETSTGQRLLRFIDFPTAFEPDAETSFFQFGRPSALFTANNGARLDQVGFFTNGVTLANNSFQDLPAPTAMLDVRGDVKATSFEGAGDSLTGVVKNSTTGEPTGSDSVLNVVSLTQAEYDAGTPVATTLYVITDA